MEINLEKIEEISSLSQLRQEYVKKWEDSYNEGSEEYEDHLSELEMDKLSDTIWAHIREHRSVLPLEFILEELTVLGGSPYLVYNDNGYFAMTEDGFNSVNSGEPVDSAINCFVYASQWKKTIREALDNYLDVDYEQ